MSASTRNLQQSPDLPRWLRPLLRRTSGADFVPVIDGLRFYAILTVLLYHALLALTQTHHLPFAGPGALAGTAVLKLGWVGVQLFFGISGFILAVPFAAQHLRGRPPVKLSKYFLRRLTRLEPPFLLSLAALFALRLLVNGQTGLWPHLAASSLYAHSAVYGEPSAISAVTWSLEVEIQFYIVAPLLGQIFRIPSKSLRRMVWLGLALLSWGLGWRYPGMGTLWLLPNLSYFLAGFVIADIHAVEWQGGRQVPHHWAWDLLATVGWIALAWVVAQTGGESGLLAWAPAVSLLILLIYLAIFQSRAWYWLTTRPLLFVGGGMCYTIYLYHNAVILGVVQKIPVYQRLLGVVGSDVAALVAATVALLAAVGLSTLLYVAVERPCMAPDWHTRLWRRLRGQGPAIP